MELRSFKMSHLIVGITKSIQTYTLGIIKRSKAYHTYYINIAIIVIYLYAIFQLKRYTYSFKAFKDSIKKKYNATIEYN